MNGPDAPIIRIEHQGAPRVHEAVVLREGPGVVAIVVVMYSKLCVAGAQAYSDGEPPELFISTDENSLHLDESKPREETTVISFPRWPGWTILCAGLARYTLTVCLVDNL